MRLLMGGLCCLLLGACGPTLDEQNPDTLTDQSGATFIWDCSKGSDCDILRGEDTPPLPGCSNPDETAAYFWGGGRLFTIYAACYSDAGWAMRPALGRATVCQTDADCPQLVQFREDIHYECRAGFCQNADREAFPPGELPDRSEMYVLCYGATPRSPDAPTSLPAELKAAVDAACPDLFAPCTSIPAGCPDLR